MKCIIEYLPVFHFLIVPNDIDLDMDNGNSGEQKENVEANSNFTVYIL